MCEVNAKRVQGKREVRDTCERRRCFLRLANLRSPEQHTLCLLFRLLGEKTFAQTLLLRVFFVQNDHGKVPHPRQYLHLPSKRDDVLPVKTSNMPFTATNDKLKIETLLCSTKLTQNGELEIHLMICS